MKVKSSAIRPGKKRAAAAASSSDHGFVKEKRKEDGDNHTLTLYRAGVLVASAFPAAAVKTNNAKLVKPSLDVDVRIADAGNS